MRNFVQLTKQKSKTNQFRFSVLAVILFVLLFYKAAHAQDSDPKSSSGAQLQTESENESLELILPESEIEKEELLENTKVESTQDPILEHYLSEASIRPEIDVRKNPKFYKRFVIVRRVFLKMVYKILAPFTRDPVQLEQKMSNLDQYLQNSSDTIARKKASGWYFSLSSSLGLGFSDIYLNKIKYKPIKKLMAFVPNFYYLLGAGIAMVTQEENGKLKRKYIYFHMVENLKDTQTYVTEISFIAFNYGYGMTTEGFARDTNYQAQNLGILGTIRTGKENFQYNLTAGISFPPVLPAFMVYRTQGYYPVVKVLSFPKFINKFWNRNSFKNSCRDLLSVY